MVYWLLLRLLPLKLIIGVTAVVLGAQMLGLDLITPAINTVESWLMDWLGSQWSWSDLTNW